MEFSSKVFFWSAIKLHIKGSAFLGSSFNVDDLNAFKFSTFVIEYISMYVGTLSWQMLFLIYFNTLNGPYRMRLSFFPSLFNHFFLPDEVTFLELTLNTVSVISHLVFLLSPLKLFNIFVHLSDVLKKFLGL